MSSIDENPDPRNPLDPNGNPPENVGEAPSRGAHSLGARAVTDGQGGGARSQPAAFGMMAATGDIDISECFDADGNQLTDYHRNLIYNLLEKQRRLAGKPDPFSGRRPDIAIAFLDLIRPGEKRRMPGRVQRNWAIPETGNGYGPFTFQIGGGRPHIVHGEVYETFNYAPCFSDIFVCPNRTDLMGRCNGNVTDVCALWVDLDGAPIENIERLRIKPLCIVTSSPGRYHAYWRVTEIQLDEFSWIMKRLAVLMNGDKNVCTLATSMRLPGTVHRKKEPFLTDFKVVDARSIDRVDFIEALKKAERTFSITPPRRKAESFNREIPEDEGPVNMDKVRSALEFVPNTDWPRDQWLLMTMILHSIDAKEEWENWSAQSRKCGTKGVAQGIWRRMRKRESGPNIGLLYHWARKNGWQWIEHSAALDAPVGFRTTEGFVIKGREQGLDYMNKHFAFIRKNGIMEIIHDPEFERLRYDFMTIDQTKELLANVYVEITIKTEDGEKKVTEPIFGFWFYSTERRQYTLGLEFHPSAAVVEMSVEHTEWLEEHKCLPAVHELRDGVLKQPRLAGRGTAPCKRPNKSLAGIWAKGEKERG